MSYRPEPEVGLIHKWLTGRGEEKHGMERGNVGMELGDPEPEIDERSRRNRVNYLLANASMDIDAPLFPPPNDEIRRASVMEAPQTQVDEDPTTNGLRISALENLYGKLDPRGQGYLEGIFLEDDSVLVRLNSKEEDMPVDLTPYERGLLGYAMPKITQAITHSGRITHDRVIYILRAILFASNQKDREAKAAQGVRSPRDQRAAWEQFNDGGGQRNLNQLLFSPADRTSPRGDEGGETLTEAGSNLLSLIVRLYTKLDPSGNGYLEDLPSAEAAGLTPFETSLLDLTRNRLQWEFHRADAEGDGKVGKQIVINMLCEAMEADLVGERRSEKRLTKDGMSRPPLETELRSIHREAARLRQGKKGYERVDTAAMCTFKPEITRRHHAQNTRPPRASATARLANTMSTKDREELIELQECTFQPNLHKCVAPKFDNPRYRTHRTRPHQKPAPSEKERYKSKVSIGAFTAWRDSLRGFDNTTPVDAVENKSPYARREPSPGKNVRKQDMDMSCGRYRKDHFSRTDKGEQDWGRCIRLTEQYFKEQPQQSPQQEEENTRMFAETFLALRASASRGRDLLL
jgi:hypothetical protein